MIRAANATAAAGRVSRQKRAYDACAIELIRERSGLVGIDRNFLAAVGTIAAAIVGVHAIGILYASLERQQLRGRQRFRGFSVLASDHERAR